MSSVGTNLFFKDIQIEIQGIYYIIYLIGYILPQNPFEIYRGNIHMSLSPEIYSKSKKTVIIN